MDGDPVTGEPSQPPENIPDSLGELFVSLCPQYMAMGMTYDQFWNRNTKMHKAYRDAYEVKQRNDEWARWRQGAYNYDALIRVAPVMRAALSNKPVRPEPYPDEPWPLTQREADARQEAKDRANYQKALAQRRAAADAARKRRAEEKRQEVK